MTESAESAERDPEKPAKTIKKCPCGHARDHVMVSPVGDYGFWGWFLMMFGISATPRVIHFRCRVCEQDVETTADPKILRETRLS